MVERAAPFMHGPQCTLTISDRSVGLGVSVHFGSVGPKMVSTGVPKALAKCRGPVSLVTSRLARRISALSGPSLMTGLSSTTAGLRRCRATSRAVEISLGPQTMNTAAPCCSTSRSETSANRSGSQHLATPNDARVDDHDRPMGPHACGGNDLQPSPRLPAW